VSKRSEHYFIAYQIHQSLEKALALQLMKMLKRQYMVSNNVHKNRHFWSCQHVAFYHV